MNGETRLKKIVVEKSDLRELGLKYSNEHLRRMEAANQFPKRLNLTPAKTQWLLNEIVDWIDKKAADRISE